MTFQVECPQALGGPTARTGASIIACLFLLVLSLACTTSGPTSEGIGDAEDGTYGHEYDPQDDVDRERLIDVVEYGDADTMRRLLREGADPNETDAYGTPRPIWAAIWTGNLEMVELLLEAGADPNTASPDGNTPAYAAALLEEPEILTAVMEAGGQAIPPDDDWLKAVNVALEQRNALLMRALIESGVDPNTQVPSGGYVDLNADGVQDLWLVPILYRAVDREDEEMVQLLLSTGADPNTTGFIFLRDGDSAEQEESLAVILGITEDPNVESGPFGDPVIFYGIKRRNTEIVNILLGSGANPNAVDRHGSSTLDQAEKLGDSEMVALLKEATR